MAVFFHGPGYVFERFASRQANFGDFADRHALDEQFRFNECHRTNIGRNIKKIIYMICFFRHDFALNVTLFHRTCVDLYAPSSLPFIFPVRKSTAPIDMNSSPLNSTSLNACETAPFKASSVPMPMPQTMKPIWLIML